MLNKKETGIINYIKAKYIIEEPIEIYSEIEKNLSKIMWLLLYLI